MKNLLNNGVSFLSTDIAGGSLRGQLPELYELSSVVENNPWHNQQTVFNHTISVLNQLETSLKFDYLFKDSREVIVSFLSTESYGYSGKDITVLVALLHDIGKKDTFIADSTGGLTDCPNHAEIGGTLSQVYLQRMGVNKRISTQVSTMVRRHGEIHEVVNRILMYNEPEKEWNAFKKSVRASYIYFLLQGYADTAGSDLPTLSPKDFKKREIIYREAINRFAAAL